MHTLVAIFGVTAIVILAIGLLSIIAGIVWVIFPLTDKIYITENIYIYSAPLGGRRTGLFILGTGIASLTVGFLLDKEYDRLSRKFGSRT